MDWLLWVVVGLCALSIPGGIIALVKYGNEQHELTMFDAMDCADTGYFTDLEQTYIIKSSVIESEQRVKELEKQLENSRYGILTIDRYYTIEPAPIVPVSRVKCEYCGSTVLSDLVNCPNCGAPL